MEVSSSDDAATPPPAAAATAEASNEEQDEKPQPQPRRPRLKTSHHHHHQQQQQHLGGSAATATGAAASPLVCSWCYESVLSRHVYLVDSRAWHEQCVRCELCSQPLAHLPSCRVRHDLRLDRHVLLCVPCSQTTTARSPVTSPAPCSSSSSSSHQPSATKCFACQRVMQSTDWVRRARQLVFHLACFACGHCKRQLSTGEQFALHENRLLCKQHYLELVEGDTAQHKTKTKRVRTTFAEHQLSILQSHFLIDSNPDGNDLERIASNTGLSKRVTQVWFQNSRARQKKYQNQKRAQAVPGTSAAARALAVGRSEDSGRSSGDGSASPPGCSGASPGGGMSFPTSVTTTAEEAIVLPPTHASNSCGLNLTAGGAVGNSSGDFSVASAIALNSLCYDS